MILRSILALLAFAACACGHSEYLAGELVAGAAASGGTGTGGGTGGGAGASGAAGGCSCSFPEQSCLKGGCAPAAASRTLAASMVGTCALRAGELWCWGRRYGTGRDPEPTDAIPTRLGEQSDLEQISTGSGEAYCAVDTSRRLYCWGGNGGNLGLGDSEPREMPALVDDEIVWGSSFHGSGHACAVDRDGKLYCWGRNDDAELGLGDTERRDEPVEVSGLPPVTTVSTGWGHTCTLAQSGSLYCWGRNSDGQLGLGDTELRSVPTELRAAGSDWLTVRINGLHSCALNRDDALYCWGRNSDGQLGVADTEVRLVPTEVLPGARFREVAPGRYHTCAIDETGRMLCWGEAQWINGDAYDGVELLTPEVKGAFDDWQSLSSGGLHTCGLRAGGAVWCWGKNASYQLGLGDTDPRDDPVQVLP